MHLDWGRFALWLVALAGGAVAFGALGVAIGALAREVRAASLLAFLLTLPIAFLALVPAGTVAAWLYDVIRAVSALFPFRAGPAGGRRGAQRRRSPAWGRRWRTSRSSPSPTWRSPAWRSPAFA